MPEEKDQSASAPQVFDAQFFAELERLELVARKVLHGHIRGERRSRRRGFSVEFMDFRPYHQGDDLRYIDWNLYGRLERFYIKLFVEEEELNLYLLIDTSASMGLYGKLTQAKRIAGALAWIVLMSNERVMVGVFDQRLDLVVRPSRGRGKVWPLLRSLEGLSAEGGTNLVRAAEVLLSRYRHPGLVVAISDFLDPAAAQGLKLLAGFGHQLAVIQILAREELDPPLEGDLSLVDVESGEQVEVSMGEGVLRRYKERLAALREELSRIAARSKGDYYLVTPDTPLRELIFGTMRQRGLVR